MDIKYLFRRRQIEYSVYGFFKEKMPYGGGCSFKIFVVVCSMEKNTDKGSIQVDMIYFTENFIMKVANETFSLGGTEMGIILLSCK